MSPFHSAPEEIRRWIDERLFASVPVSIAVVDRAYRIVLANPAFEERFGAWHDLQCWEVYKNRVERCADCPAERAFEEGTVQVRQEVGRNRQGEEAHYFVHVAPIRSGRDNSIPYCIEMSTDITEVHRLQQEKIEAERLAAVGQTVAGLAHGIKNIITGLEGGMYVMRTGLARNRQERVDNGWQMLERNVERISAMARNLLSFSKGHTPEVRLVDAASLVRELADSFRGAAAAVGVELADRWDEGMAPAALDATELHNCLANLVSNAIDACQMSDNRSGHVELRAREEGGNLVFEVTDDGVGMDVEVKKKIFTTFFTTKGSSGTGLGLLLTRRVVQEHGGSVEIESELGQGTRFRIVLPRSRLPKPRPELSDGEDHDGQT